MKKIFIYGMPNILVNYKKAVSRSCFNATCIISTNINESTECDALLLAGGGDVSPCLYHSCENKCKSVDLIRDIDEEYLIARFIKEDKPILGVCRGMQILNVFFGGTLNQTIEKAKKHYNNEKDVYHNVYNCKKGFMNELFGDKTMVNSAHRQSVKALGEKLFVCSKSSDNIVEALQHENGRIIAVQFHPERLSGENEQTGKVIYDYFLSLIK